MTDFQDRIGEILNKVQTELKAPKNLTNKFGGYNYRNAEGILEALKPLEKKYGFYTVISDEVVEIGGRIYVKATATIYAGGSFINVSGYAREADTKKGMDEAQITGAASSYARKYALNGLFLLDDSKDADTDEYQAPERRASAPKAEPIPAPKAPATFICDRCKKIIEPYGKATPSAIASKSKKDFGVQMCYACAHAEKVAREQAEADGLPFPIE